MNMTEDVSLLSDEQAAQQLAWWSEAKEYYAKRVAYYRDRATKMYTRLNRHCTKKKKPHRRMNIMKKMQNASNDAQKFHSMMESASARITELGERSKQQSK